MAEFTEAPASVSIKTYSKDGFDVMVTIRDTDTAALMGRMKAALDWLSQNGFKPTGGANGYKAQGSNSAPVCKYHGPMKRSKKFDGWYCPSQMGDGSGYCQEKVMD